ncbi:MAG: hypothetical protein DMG56_11815 [Acidobacteria bacterium]|nr:MAG: hypothetical protein DMG56_11815 [Acidobacteriota bacterium]
MRLRPAAVLKVNLRNAYPRCYVTRRIPIDEAGLPTGGTYYGPFASRRSAQAFAERILDLFKVRRCQIKIRRDPMFPGCLYSEMKMCLAPCFAGCTKEEYDVEVRRLVQFLDTSGGSLRSTMEEERERASEQSDFERAAAWHKKVEKLDEILRGRPELTRRIQDLDAFCSRPRKSKPWASTACAVEDWQSHFSCDSRRLPASPGQQSKSSASILKRCPEQRKEILGSTYGLWRGGITAIRAKARFSSARRTGLIVGFFGHARDFSRRRPAKPKRSRPPGRLNRPKEGHEQIRYQRRNHAIRAEVRRPCCQGSFSRNAEVGALLSRNRHVPRATGRKDG